MSCWPLVPALFPTWHLNMLIVFQKAQIHPGWQASTFNWLSILTPLFLPWGMQNCFPMHSSLLFNFQLFHYLMFLTFILWEFYTYIQMSFNQIHPSIPDSIPPYPPPNFSLTIWCVLFFKTHWIPLVLPSWTLVKVPLLDHIHSFF